MLLKKIKLRHNVVIDMDSFYKETIIFKRVSGASPCFEEENYGHPEFNDIRCKYYQECPLKYTCSIINTPRYNNYSYIPSV